MTPSFVSVSSLLVVTSLISCASCQDICNGYFPYQETLDDNSEVGWNFNSTHIAFEVRVKTNGYVGFGISGSGAMFPSDIVIGWVKDGNVHFTDRYATGYYLPAIDDRQDWHLLNATEEGDYTTLSMVRELDTCDDQDMPITDGVTHLIYSYFPTDPTSENAIPYHGPERRGSKPLHLLKPSVTSRGAKPLPSDAKFLDFLNNGYEVPGRDTMYRCTTWKIPELDGKHHMIRFEPVIQPGHERLVHHMILYFCAVPMPENLVGIEYECYDLQTEAAPPVFKDCQHVFVVWAVGGGPVEFPDHVGVPLGSPGDPRYFLLETHYDNPALRTDFVDSSGIRITLTKQLRQNDAGVLETGIPVSEFPIVPPFNSDFLYQGHCQRECFEEAMGDQEEFNMFGIMLHSHLMGRKLRVRMFRNGTELAPIQENNHYDFDYQEYTLIEERTFKKGDSLITECEYDSTDRLEVSWGGLSTRNEMCLSFILYYPRIPLTACYSRPYYFVPGNRTRYQFLVYLHLLNWTDPTVQEGFRIGIEEAPLYNRCEGDAIIYNFSESVTTIPEVIEEYVPPSVCLD